MSRLVHLMGHIAGDKDTFAMLALLLDLARLSDTLASLRDAQQRYHQAEAARAPPPSCARPPTPPDGWPRTRARRTGPDRRSRTSPHSAEPDAEPSTRPRRAARPMTLPTP